MTASKVVSIFLRIGEGACAVIVLALLARFLYLVDQGNGDVHGRLIYAEVTAALSVAFSIIFLIPSTFSFYGFLMDFILFIMNIVAFGLLINLSGGCGSVWYYNYWGFYWGGFWRVGSPVFFGTPGCAQWRCTNAFLCIGALIWLLSAFLGLYVVMEKLPSRDGSSRFRLTKRSRDHDHMETAEVKG